MQLTQYFIKILLSSGQFSMVAHIPSCLGYCSPSFILCALRIQELNKIFTNGF